jgi:hypothetical protein
MLDERREVDSKAQTGANFMRILIQIGSQTDHAPAASVQIDRDLPPLDSPSAGGP